MLYFKEFFFRLIYSIIFLIIILILSYYYNNFLLNLLLAPVTKQFSSKSIIFELSYISNSPFNIIDLNFWVCLIFSVSFWLPFLIFQILFFCYSGLYSIEYKKINSVVLVSILFYYILNILNIFFIFPYLWYFIEYLSLILSNYTEMNVEYEPNLLNYLNFIYKFSLITNFVYIIFQIFFIYFKLKNFEYYVLYEKYTSIFIRVFFLLILIFLIEFDFFTLFFSLIFFLVIEIIKLILLIVSIFNLKRKKSLYSINL